MKTKKNKKKQKNKNKQKRKKNADHPRLLYLLQRKQLWKGSVF